MLGLGNICCLNFKYIINHNNNIIVIIHKFFTFRISNKPTLIDGLSLNGTSLYQLRFGRQTSHKVRVILNVENWSRFTLLDSQTDIHCGDVLQRFPAPNVYPGYREVMLGVGTEVFSGTCGTVSWQVLMCYIRKGFYSLSYIPYWN